MAKKSSQSLDIVTPIEKFGSKGEKTGWSYISISAAEAAQLSGGQKTSFRVKGYLDALEVEQLALIPMGDGNFILPLNGDLRKLLRKKEGQSLHVRLSLDHNVYQLNPEMMECLTEDKRAIQRFQSLPLSHQRYFSKWVDSAKTAPTKADRIYKTLYAMQHSMDYGQMIRHFSGKGR